MKKLFGLLIVFMFIAGFAGCNGVTTLPPTTAAPTTEAPTTYVPTTTVDNAPVFNGVEDVTIDEGTNYDLLTGITVEDDLDGDITSSIIVNDNGFDYQVPGTYTINLSVTDSGDNTVEASFVITVVETGPTNEDLALLDVNSVNLTFPNLTLPKFGANGTYFYWSSSNPMVITGSGFIINPPVGSNPEEVILTLRAVNGTYITTKNFTFTVQPNQEVSVTSQVQLPFEGTSTEYVVANNPAVDIFYVDNGSVPYVDVQTFITLLEGAIDTSIISYSNPQPDVLRVSYDIEYLDLDGVTTITESYYAEINFTDNTFTVNNFDFFAGYIASTESDYGEGLNYVDADYVDGQEVVIPLGFYNFDLVVYNDGVENYYLMPLHVANRLFAGDIYYDVYYNGDKLWGIDTFVISSDSDPALITQIQTSSLNSASAPTDMKLATYNFLAFVMDYFYGLKPEKGYDTYYEVLYAYAESMIKGGDINLYSKIFNLAYGLDDLHTSYQFDGYWENPRVPGLSINDLGPKSTAFYEGLWAMQDLLDIKFGSYSNLPEYSLINNDTIAIIHITGFNIDTPNEFKAILDGLPSSVEDVVIDLSYNTGGNIGAVMRIFGYMTEGQYTYHSQNPADGSAVTYYIESDYVAYNYNWYVLTSSVTFSAANMFASMAKELGIPILGQNSSGGACSIGVVMNPDGSAIMISTNNVLSTRIGNEVDGYQYLSVEGGIEVDYFMSNVTSDTKLIEIITQIKAQG